MPSMTFDAWLSAACWPWNGDMNRGRDLWMSGCDPKDHQRAPRIAAPSAPMTPASVPENAPTHVTYNASMESLKESGAIGFHVAIGDPDKHILVVQGPFDGIRETREWFREELPSSKKLGPVAEDAKHACIVRVRRGHVVEKIETWTKARTVWHRD